jgi:glucose/arabinose dehydrogenase
MHKLTRQGVMLAVALAFGATQAVSQDKKEEEPFWAVGRPKGDATAKMAPVPAFPLATPADKLPVKKIKLPPGFKAEVYQAGVLDARGMREGDKGTVFVSSLFVAGKIYAITNKGGKREVKTIAEKLFLPNGIEFHKGSLFVATPKDVTRYDNIEANLDNPGEPKVVADNLDPNRQPGHFWKFLAMGPDGKLYFNIGAPGNIVMPTYMEASIMRVSPNGGPLELVASGVRNSVGMDFNPKDKTLWFTDNQTDGMGDDMPNDTLHRVAAKTVPNFGYPFCHQGDIQDPEYGKYHACKEFAKPALKLGTHIAPLGMRFYTGKMFGPDYQNSIFIAMHGSWNRSTKQGYNVMRVKLDAKGNPKMEPFLTGFLTDEKGDPPMWGRPVDVLVMKDGALLVSDDYNGILYRVSRSK